MSLSLTKMLKSVLCTKIGLNSILFLTILSARVTCFSSEWEAFADTLLPDLCPLIATIKTTFDDLFTTHSMDKKGPMPPNLVAESLKCGRDISRAADDRGAKLVTSGINLDSYPGPIRGFFTSTLTADGKLASKTSKEILAATKIMQMKVCSGSDVTPNTFMSFLEQQVIKLQDLSFCKPYTKVCSSSVKYRSLDGTCNNLKNPGWGRKMSPFTRIAKPRYADGIHSMPVSRSGDQLPNSRVLSTRLFADRNIHSRVLTQMNSQYAQFITHDMAARVMETTEKGGIQCCMGGGTGRLSSEHMNDMCIPIIVPDNDYFYSQFGVKCLNFVRSVTAPRDDCSLGYAEQLNAVTSFIDASTIYGSGSLSEKLRSKSGGKLKIKKRGKTCRGFLPDEKKEKCSLRNNSDPCYLAGDFRVNQTPSLSVIHTLFVREHNRIADVLGSLNPLWSDERLYQEARRILIAELQHITYHEWLPLNLGDNYVRYYQISPSTLYSHDYNPDVNPGVINSFAAAAFRFLHSAISESIISCPAGYQGAYQYRLSDYYLNPSLLEQSESSLDDLVRGLITYSASELDPHVTSEVSNQFLKSHNSWGLDLVAMDIMRGRDHGLGSYNTYREICGLRKATTFQDLGGEMSQDRINALYHFYETVDDIDLFVGGSLEHAVPGSIFGPTFQCIIAEQFYRSRIGDRFFYDNGEMKHGFTYDQLREIKKSSMARVICDNTDGVFYVQKRAFELESPYNPRFRCDDYANIPHVDLTPWRKDLFDIFD